MIKKRKNPQKGKQRYSFYDRNIKKYIVFHKDFFDVTLNRDTYIIDKKFDSFKELQDYKKIHTGTPYQHYNKFDSNKFLSVRKWALSDKAARKDRKESGRDMMQEYYESLLTPEEIKEPQTISLSGLEIFINLKYYPHKIYLSNNTKYILSQYLRVTGLYPYFITFWSDEAGISFKGNITQDIIMDWKKMNSWCMDRVNAFGRMEIVGNFEDGEVRIKVE